MGETAILIAGLAISAASAGATAYASSESAKRQNEAIARSLASRRKTAAKQAGMLADRRENVVAQVEDAADLEALKIEKQRAAALGAYKVAAAEGGLSTSSGAGEMLMNYASQEAAFSQGVLTQNTTAQLAQIQKDTEMQQLQNAATYEAQLNQAMVQMQSPFLASLGGGISGAGTGLQFASGVKSLSTPSRTTGDAIT